MLFLSICRPNCSVLAHLEKSKKNIGMLGALIVCEAPLSFFGMKLGFAKIKRRKRLYKFTI